MDLKPELEELTRKYKNLSSSADEKNTENWFILPFLGHLGYDDHDPNIVQAQYPVDGVGKVDYAIFGNNREPVIYVECKQLREPLGQHRAQLKKYFNSSPSVKFGLLTNGYEYRFYTDLDRENMLDRQPFLSFNLETDTSKYLESLSIFTRQNFNVSEARSLALTLSYHSKILEYLKREIEKPSDDLVRFITKNAVGETKKSVRDKIKPILPSIFDELLGHGDNRNGGVIEPPEDDPPDAVNIFDINDPTGKTLEYYIFDGERYTGRVADMFVAVFENLFRRNKELTSNFKGSPVKQSRPQHLHMCLVDGYFLDKSYSNLYKFKKLKKALAEFDLKDILYVKLRDKRTT